MLSRIFRKNRDRTNIDTAKTDVGTIDREKLPCHVAITMDGNGRWAQNRNMVRTAGHDEGMHTAKRIVGFASDIGIKHLTLYIFSTENWKRAETEVGFLMNLIHTNLCNEIDFYKEHKIKLNYIGDFSRLPKQIQDDVKNAVEATSTFATEGKDGMILNMAVNYGGRDEIIRGINKYISSGSKKELDEKTFAEYLDMPDSPDVDLLIRTGGEKRLSNFLLWHVAYSEMVFTNTLWPDFSNEEFMECIQEYSRRNRRFGAEKAITGSKK